jgi:hypothetical protein
VIKIIGNMLCTLLLVLSASVVLSLIEQASLRFCKTCDTRARPFVSNSSMNRLASIRLILHVYDLQVLHLEMMT